ncbi:MAG: Anaerobic ribonucleoside-triphosphate reductase activating protein [candidate division WS6 bacterium GW2011_GWF2_39_15]|uniref:Anaerobic ribonucleoside-triphosphate reductase activating protein n=1 Tax=candidate division WS6 bacterium GW2011_GWF2_39_15 TaxID=1619100 RepID=A0A0G0QWW3_9BACT|nr:MAG: Anaerobic ribonucleoside-triphosphate reductase activating protein [candidate division WS6 bacterium GW2011_GWF2_39_15]
MLIQHLEKLTLLDFPGRVAAVVFTYGCNLRCPYCHNPELVTQGVKEDLLLSENDVISFLQTRRNVLDGLVITGGEPTVHKDLIAFIRKVKKVLPNLQIKLDTNGTFPEKVAQIIEEGLVDYWAMDIKYAEELYQQGLNGGMKAMHIKESIEMIKNSGTEFEFRTTVMKGLHDSEVMKKIGLLIKGSPVYYIQNFRAGKSIDPTLDSSKSYTSQELNEFAEIVGKYVDRVEIRN